LNAQNFFGFRSIAFYELLLSQSGTPGSRSVGAQRSTFYAPSIQLEDGHSDGLARIKSSRECSK
ncbi:MAG: hypothetical protein KDD35_12030, partial [Bdellovibrionales bacterium]|nr:hypothetical protein [Bdellovibrionales bacterium]